MKNATDLTESTILTIDGNLATIELNRPDRYNAIDSAMRASLIRHIKIVEEDASVRCVILKGRGSGFSAGSALNDGEYDPISTLILGEYKPIFDAITNSQKFYIAEVHGRAAGIGGSLALNCDLVIMAEDSALYLAFAAIALVPDGGLTWHLVNRLGPKQALEAIVSGHQITAMDCVRHGLANIAVPSDRLTETSGELARRIAAAAPLAASAAKRLVREATSMSFDAVVASEAEAQNGLVKSKDFQLGVNALKSRSLPQFLGK